MKKVQVVLATAVLLIGFHAGAQDAKREVTAAKTRLAVDDAHPVHMVDMTKTPFTSDFAYKKLDTFTGYVCNAGLTKGKGHGTIFLNFGAANCDPWKSPTVFSTVNNNVDPAFINSLKDHMVTVKEAFFKLDETGRERYVAYVPIELGSDRFSVMQGKNYVAITALNADAAKMVRTDMPKAMVKAVDGKVEKAAVVEQNVTKNAATTTIRGRQSRDENRGFLFNIRKFFGFSD